MFILGVHEMGHYLMARRYGMNASLPYFIPAPPPIIFGTFGAFISIRDPMPNRRALFDIGIAGPLSGFVAAIPVVMIGLYLTTGDVDDVGRSGDYILLHLPLLYVLLQHLVPPSGTLLHPTAFAGWVGLLVTAMNLLPAGQLDGGHIARAFLRDRAKYAAYGSIAVLLLLGLAFPGWIVFAFLIFFLGVRHPPPLDDVTTLDGKRKAMGAVVVLVMVLSFVPIPMETMHYEAPEYSMEFGPHQSVGVVPEGGSWTFHVPVVNTGNRDDTIDVDASWNVSGNVTAGPPSITLEWNRTVLYEGRGVTINLTVESPASADVGGRYDVDIAVASENGSHVNTTVTLLIGDVSLLIGQHPDTVPPGRYLEIPFDLDEFSGTDRADLSITAPNATFFVTTRPVGEILVSNASGVVQNVTVPAGPASLFITFNATGEREVVLGIASTTTSFRFEVPLRVLVTKG